MASVALTSLISTIQLQFLQPPPRVSLHDDRAPIKSFFETLSSLREFLETFDLRGAAIEDLEIKIRDFALKSEDDIEMQLSDFLLSRDTEHREEASQKLCQTLREAAENAAELLEISNIEKDGETERKMSYDALTSLMATIQLRFLQSFTRVSCVQAPPKSLKENLCSLREFLEISNSHGAGIKDLETRIREFALKAKDNIKTLLGKIRFAKDTQRREKASRKLHQTLRQVAENAAELLNIINSTTNNVKGDGSLRCSPKFEDRMVGRQNDVRTIKNQLFSGFGGLKVIPIIGMLGIGKTTLARRIFEDQLVASHFQVKCWITIPQKYNDSQMLRDILLSIIPAKPHEIGKGISPGELAELVRECLIHRRYLIVLDDIWSTQHWEDIKRCFPSSENGSRVLLTTRFYEVADYACSIKGNHHVMSLLDSNESWDLFCNIFPLEKYSAPRFENFRSHLFHVVEKCDGLPQTIVVVAERLSECNNNIQHELKKIEKELESLGILGHSALTLIFSQLPEELKVCFLYLGVFPKRSEIQVKTLLRLWIAEGFVKPSKHEELEKNAYGYLEGLVNRSLVLISSRSFDGKIKTCTVHSALHNICSREAQKEGILCVVNTQKLPRWSDVFASSCRWLSLYTHSFDYYVLFTLNNPRSIFFFHENPEICVPFKLLRVLAFVPSAFLQRVPMQLGDLVFLRYLSVTQWFEGLDDVVSTNLNLQTLVVSGSELQLGAPTRHLPSTIWESPQLRHLELGTLYTVDPPSVVKENLQTLSWVGPIHCRKEVYLKFPNIKKLKMFCKEDLEPSHTCGSCSNPIILGNLDYLVELEMLKISVPVGSSITLPEQSVFPLQLKKLTLSGINLSERDLTVIGTLQWLEVLKLENAFHGKVWEVVEGGFYRLRFLLLEAKKLEPLKVYIDSFPCLERLVLKSCSCLEEIPSSFGEIFTLQSIELDRHSHPSVIASAKDIQANLLEYYGKGNFEIKIHGYEYDESQHTQIVESVEDNLASSHSWHLP
ncbi:PREDICTED: putative late blight resistance protein homolog R1C-3 [Ipomoea nil]|uniref:putative late blight resistance protein homolog R1C-3 n=1 Tax=Ipomoea nil TaxID=35883 RepID=UPI000900D189|nr:PREDICTED: putative late blight resistance protein homolog R1C-3 [Ipomoea nil]